MSSRPAIHPLLLRAAALAPRPAANSVISVPETPAVRVSPVGDGLLQVLKAAA